VCQLPVELAAVTRSFPSCLPDLVRIYSVNGSTAKGKRVKSNTVLIVRMFAIDALNESNYSHSPRISILSYAIGRTTRCAESLDFGRQDVEPNIQWIS
jgi:hypothetical protein